MPGALTHSLADLPDGVIAIICIILMDSDPLTLIYSAPNICHSWRAVCRDQVPLKLSAGWDRGPSYSKFATNPGAYLPVAFKRFRWVTSLALRGPVEWGQLLQLRHLDLSQCKMLTDSSVIALAAGCGRLERLNLNQCHQINQCHHLNQCHHRNQCHHITDTSVTALAIGCRRLERLDLTCCRNITDVSVIALAASCGRLEISQS
jgi:hypothetical protein